MRSKSPPVKEQTGEKDRGLGHLGKHRAPSVTRVKEKAEISEVKSVRWRNCGSIPSIPVMGRG